MANYQAIHGLQLGADLQRQLRSLIWQQLGVTTEVTRLQIFRRMIRTGDNCLDYLSYYGWMLGRVARVKNLRLDAELEQQVVDIVQKYFDCSESPAVRLQVMFGGEILPLHTDITRHASLVVPISNHLDTSTHFYQATQPIDPALPNPRKCICIDSIKIIEPTLIDTDCIHSVVSTKPISPHRPRISLTAKWTNTKFKELI